MTQNRFYSSLTKRTTTTVDPGTSGTTLTVADTSSFASLDSSFPYTLLINWGLTDQEIVNVTARPSSTTFTVVRGQDGSTGQAHAVGATVDHGVSARDFTEAGAHVGATSGVHGLTGSVVGTTDTQTLTGKTIGDNLNVNGNLTVGGVGKLLYAAKTTDQSITSNATLFNDADLTLPVAANAKYLMTAILRYEADATSGAGDINTAWAGPSGSIAVGALVALLSTATSDANVYITGYSVSDTHGAGGRGAGAIRAMQFFGTLITGASAGSLTLQWAQLTTSTIATILYTGSFVSLQRVV